MNILIVMAGFFPGKNYGGPPVSVDNFCTLMKDFDCFIVSRNHDLGNNEPYKDISKGWNHRGNCIVKYLADNNYNYDGFKKIIEDINPDLIYLQGLFQSCVFPCLKLAKEYQIKVLLAPRGELNKGAFKKKYKKIPYIVMLKLLNLTQGVHFQSTSKEETNAIKKYLHAGHGNIHLLPNIPSIPKNLNTSLKKEKNKARFIFLSRIHPKKNLLYAIKLFNHINYDVIFDIFGPIEDEEYWEKCKKEISKLPRNIRVSYKGIVNHEYIHEVFSMYDSFIFPTFSENYGHVISEALMSMCIPIISNNTPWTDINHYNAGWSIPLIDTLKFEKAIKTIILMDNEEKIYYEKNIQKYLKNKVNIEEIKNEYYMTISNL